MLKKLLSSVREYKKDIILAPLYVTLESIFEILIPTIMAFLIDSGINNKSMSHILWTGIALIVAALLSLLFGILAGRSAAISASGFSKNLRQDLFYKVQNFSFSNIDKFSSPSIITRMTTDITNIQNAFQMLVRLAVRAPMMILFAMIFSFRIDAKLSIIFVAIIPVLGVGLWLIMMTVHPLFKTVFKTYDNLNNVVQENLHGIRVVKSYTRENHENEKFTEISQSIFLNFSKAEKRMAFNMPLMQLCLYTSMLLLSWFGAKAIVTSGNNPALGLSTGELTSLITYAMQILMSLMMLSMVVVMITISRASAERVVEILNEEVDLKNSDHPIYTIETGDILFEDVSFTYTKDATKPVLHNINLSIKSGETVGIIGGTGSSKSSLIQLIPRLYDATSGKITISGVDIRNYDIESLRNQVAVVLQKNVLFSGTIKENLRWGNENATDAEIIHACEIAQADGFIRAFQDQYDTYIEQGGTNVSGGQRQRLCIARALLKNPKILILDDSTSAVDTKTDTLIRQSLRQEIPNTTKIIIAQRTSSVQDADKIIVMDDGGINATGTHDELLKNCEIYKEVYESQTKGGGLHE